MGGRGTGRRALVREVRRAGGVPVQKLGIDLDKGRSDEFVPYQQGEEREDEDAAVRRLDHPLLLITFSQYSLVSVLTVPARERPVLVSVFFLARWLLGRMPRGGGAGGSGCGGAS